MNKFRQHDKKKNSKYIYFIFGVNLLSKML